LIIFEIYFINDTIYYKKQYYHTSNKRYIQNSNFIILAKNPYIIIKVCYLFMIMVMVICEECLYTDKKVEFVKNSDYCKECICDHSMCPNCKSAYHTVTITE
jgi:hypothetical protein